MLIYINNIEKNIFYLNEENTLKNLLIYVHFMLTL